MNQKYIGRLAPSPTGALHLGNIRTFLIAWLRARSLNGRLIMRIEDLDHPKVKPNAVSGMIEDLRWLGFDWDEEFVQSSRRDFYRHALYSLHREKLVYPCICSRRDVEQAQSAPHEGEQLFYPGICRNRFPDWDSATRAAQSRTPCWRFQVAENTRVSFSDVFKGEYSQDISKVMGDFPLARDVDGAGYTLAAVFDDLEMGVTEVVRGDDLLAATPSQILLSRALIEKCPCLKNSTLPNYCHVPLVVGEDGKRLAKRHGDTRVAFFREAGVRPERIIGYLASFCGWCENGEEISLANLLPRFNLSTLPKEKFVVSKHLFEDLSP